MKKFIWLTVPFLVMLSLILMLNKQQEMLLEQGGLEQGQIVTGLIDDEESAVAALPVYGEEIDFTLTDTSEKDFNFKDHNGSVRLVSFFFTSCPEVCPALNGKLKKIHKEYADNEELQLVSVSVDPKRDTPEVLKSYAERLEAGERWHFLTGENDKIQSILRNNFMLGSSGLPDMHSSAVMLVDRKGQLRGFYRVLEEGGIEQLQEALKVVL